MNCEVCGRAVLDVPITRKLMWQERFFCSGQCAALFDRRLFESVIPPAARPGEVGPG